MSKILLVDDDVDLAELIKTKLISQGHEVVVVNHGEGAFEMAKQVKPDIALLDIMLPGVTGFQISRKIRMDPELYPISILLLTALGDEPEMLHGLEQGADDYLTKPFKLEKLIEKVNYLGVLRDSISKRNTVTNYPGMEAVRREINHRLARNIKLAVCYIDLTNFNPYCAAKGKDGQLKALEFISKLIVSVRTGMGVYESFVAHPGGASFAVLLNSEDYERFCNGLIEAFDQRIHELYTADEVKQGYIVARNRRGEDGHYSLMSLFIGVAQNEDRVYKNAKKMFEVLGQIQQIPRDKEKSVFFVDRRTADR